LAGRDVALTQKVADIGGTGSWPASDLVVAAYALAELPAAARARVVDAAWRAATRVLVLVEPGTPDGFAHIHDARAALIAAGAHVLAPCPHEGPCPMRAAAASGDWCHFAVRVPRTRRHRQVKGGTLGYEDEKYAYLVVSRDAHPGRPEARVLRHPRIEKGRIALALCTPDGAPRQIITRRDQSWRAARKVEWGDPWPDR
jgi:ribosomal protein RSM22 (predicted rRNA methylase)